MIEVTQGEEIVLTLALTDKKTGRRFDLTGYDQFKVCVDSENGGAAIQATEVNATGTIVEKIADDLIGELQATFSAASGDSSAIKLNEELTLYLEISKSTDVPSKPLRKSFARALFVVPFECP